MKERDNRAGCFVDDLLDRFERMLRAGPETDEGNVRLFARRQGANLAHLDLRGEHLVP